MRHGILLILSLTIAAPAFAQSRCASEWKALTEELSDIARLDVPAIGVMRERADGGCTTNGIRLPGGRHLEFTLDQISWKGRDMDRLVTDGLPPTAFDLEVRGLRFVPKTGNSTLEYLQDIQSRGRKTDISISLDWDAEENVLRLDDLLVSFPGEDFVSIKAVIEDVDISTLASLQTSAGRFGVTKTTVTVHSRSFFQDYLLLPLGLALLDGRDDPDARLQELKVIAQDNIESAPTEHLNATSKRALQRLVTEMPDPSGVLTVVQSADPGLGVARGMALAMNRERMDDATAFWGLLDGISFEITYDPL